MWNDIDLYHSYRDFTTDPVKFPPDKVRRFIAELVRFSLNSTVKKAYAYVLSRPATTRDVRFHS